MVVGAIKELGWVDRRRSDRDVGRYRRRGEVSRLDEKMTRRIADWLYSYRLIPWLITAALLPALMWPASWWFDVKSIHVQNTWSGERIGMIVDRKINRPFRGEWQVTIRSWDGSGWVTWCNASGASHYATEAKFPKMLTLDWWTNGQCHPLPSGRYMMQTSWRIAAPVQDKMVSVDSNVFEVE